MENKVFKFNYSAIPLFLAFVAAILYTCVLKPVVNVDNVYVKLSLSEYLFKYIDFTSFFLIAFFALATSVLCNFTSKALKIATSILLIAFAIFEGLFLGIDFSRVVSSQDYSYIFSFVSSLIGFGLLIFVFVISLLNLFKGYTMKLWYLPLIIFGVKLLLDVIYLIIAKPVFDNVLSRNDFFMPAILCLVSGGAALLCLNYVSPKTEQVEEQNIEQPQEQVETPVQEKKKTQAQPIEEPVTQKRKTQAYEVPNTEDITITPQQRRRTQAYDIPQEDYQPQIKKRTQAYDIPTVDATQPTGRKTQAQPVEPQVKPRSTRAFDINQTQYQQTQTQSQNIRGRRTQGMNVPPVEPQQGNYNSMENVHRDLSRLKRMLDNGLITQEDYDRLKTQIFK